MPFEGLGSIESWAESREHRLVATRLWAGDQLPSIDEVEMLVVMGGPMGVGDEDKFGWLAPEKAFIGAAIEGGAVVLGICLGAQLIASAMGAAVRPNRLKEIGWFPVTLSPDGRESSFSTILPTEFTAFHWHGDTFDIPDNATHLASSAACANQAFAVGERVLALQFHLETLPENVDALIENCADELVEGEWIQTGDEMKSGTAAINEATTTLDAILDRMVAATP